MRHITEKHCKICGATFMGGPNACYCTICREEQRKKTNREHKYRKRHGLARSVGDIQICIDCGCKYPFYIGASDRCPECAMKHGKIIDKQKSREWNANNREKYLSAKNEFEKRRRANTEAIKTMKKYVTFDRANRKYRVVVKGKHIGYFNNLSDAIQARDNVLDPQKNDKSYLSDKENIMKVREIIEISGWLANQGICYTELYEDRIIEVDARLFDPESEYDWSWWKPDNLPENEDLVITVKYYPVDCDLLFDNVEPIASFEAWQSNLIAKQRV